MTSKHENANRPAAPDEREVADRYPWEPERRAVISTPTVQGRGSQVREDLRRLPSEYVTNDPDDPDKVHPLDPGHVRDSIAEDRYAQEESGAPSPEKAGVPPYRPVQQDPVDLIALNVTKHLLTTAAGEFERGRAHGLRVYHLWFPKNDIRVYELRAGNPPPDSDRPKHMRGIDLVVDPCRINPRVLKMIKSDPERLKRFQLSVDEGILEVAKKHLNALGLIV